MEDLTELTVVEIKQRLREIGLPVSGKKSELIVRLKDSEEKFLSLDEGDAEVAVERKMNPRPSTPSDSKSQTSCPNCKAALRYPSDYRGMLTCPQCNHAFEENSIQINFGQTLLSSSVVVFLLTIIITMILAYSVDASSEGQLGQGLAIAYVCTGGLTISGVLLLFAMVYKLAKRPLNVR